MNLGGLRRLGHWSPFSLRTRIIAWFIGVLAVAMLATVVVTRTVVLIRLDQRIDAELTQEAGELRRLAAGNDPQTGSPFGSRVHRIFDVYFDRNVPSRNEALIAFVDGRPYRRSRQVVPYRLDADRELVARWGGLKRFERGGVDTPAGPVEYIAVPLKVGERTGGVFVAAIFYERETDAADAILAAVAGVGLAVLLLGSLLAWRLAARVVEPVAELTATARASSETDLSRRIPVTGRDEVAQLATTFNAMLERLERAFESQRRFVDDAGHELKTPLTIVRGHLELLDEEPKRRRETLALVLDELDRMRRIVDDLLLLAKREQPDFLDLATLEVGALTDELEPKAAALSSRPWIVERRGQGVIVGDRQRLTQAVLQLAENAARHAVGEGPLVLGSAVENGEARFWVSDRGPGIDPSAEARLFERFGRGPGARRSDGAGLGLAIVKAIAEAHHGRIEVAPRAGGGTTFTVTVPVDQPVTEEYA